MQDNAVPILVVQEGQLAGKRWPLNKTEFVIGRGEDCDIVLPDRQVSRHHFRVVRDDDGYNVEDLGSKNGTYINGAPVRGSMQLQDGDEIQVALSVRLLFVGAEATLPLTQEMLRVAQPGLRLNKSQRQVWVNGAVLDPPLSLSQYRLLEVLWEHKGKIVTREEVISAVWPESDEAGITEQAIDALVRRLRDRLAEVDHDHEYLVTVRGHGFRLDNRP
ncbi:MAG TPA: FHA domain-containing protein [Anaerolineae bacterium]|nr:FHA domain-containing protein [Anaerolineae bacterium]